MEKCDSRTVAHAEPRPRTPDRSKCRVLVVEGLEELQTHADEWQDLADAAIEPNVFYEPWMLQYAVRWFIRIEAVRFVFIYAPDVLGSGREVLAGFFPISICVHYHGIPLKTMSFLKHKYCFLSVPLLRQGYAEEALGEFCAWLDDRPFGCSILEMEQVLGSGPFADLLREVIWKHRKFALTTKWHPRAFMKRMASGEAYLNHAISKGHRKDLARKERRLSEIGAVEYRRLDESENPSEWIEQFLALEGSGWKGKAGTAFAMSYADRLFFRDSMMDAHKRGKLMMLGLFVGSKPVALKCNLASGVGSYAFKIAFDENYCHYSPGLLLEHENIRAMHESPALQWMDSCADPDHPMFQRLWTEQRMIQTVVVSLGSRIADLSVAAVPLLRSARRLLIFRKPAGQNEDHEPSRTEPEPVAEVSACQIEKQQQLGRMARPGILFVPYAIGRRFWSYLRRNGLFATVVKTTQVILSSIRGLFRPKHSVSPVRAKQSDEVLSLEPGEWVEVKTMAEIHKTLDEQGMHRGLLFTGEMSDYCGKRFRVHRRMEFLYNERTRQQRRLKNTVLLEGSFCRGTGFGCDRSCFHFWREAWLKRVAVEGGDGSAASQEATARKAGPRNGCQILDGNP